MPWMLLKYKLRTSVSSPNKETRQNKTIGSCPRPFCEKAAEQTARCNPSPSFAHAHQVQKVAASALETRSKREQRRVRQRPQETRKTVSDTTFKTEACSFSTRVPPECLLHSESSWRQAKQNHDRKNPARYLQSMQRSVHQAQTPTRHLKADPYQRATLFISEPSILV